MITSPRKAERPPFRDLDFNYESPVVIAVLGLVAAIFVLTLVL